MPIAAVISLLTALEPFVVDAIGFWTKAKEDLSQSDEWSPEYEATVDARIEKYNTNPDERDKQQPL